MNCTISEDIRMIEYFRTGDRQRVRFGRMDFVSKQTLAIRLGILKGRT
jgi:hypothetical protein